MPPPLPPPAEAAVGMSAAAPMAATVAMAKIVLRIMGLSPGFLLDVLSTSCPSVGRAIRRVQWCLDKKQGPKSLGAREGPRTSLREADVFRPAGAGPLVAVWLVPQGRARSRAPSRGLPR